MYHIGEYVVYGVHGVCRVRGTEKQLVNRKRTEFLVLEPMVNSESRFYVPIENPAAMCKLKPVLTKDEMCQLLNCAEIRSGTFIQEENLRKQHYRDLFASTDRIALLQTVSSLYRYKEDQNAAGKKFHQCDDNFLRDAEKLLCSEIGLVMELSQEQAKEYLRNHIG